MGRNCCVPGCSSNRNRCLNLAMYKFPENEELKGVWLKNIEIDKWENYKTVCIRHFEEKFLLRDDIFPIQGGEPIFLPRKRPLLTYDAVPTLFPDPRPVRKLTNPQGKGTVIGEKTNSFQKCSTDLSQQDRIEGFIGQVTSEISDLESGSLGSGRSKPNKLVHFEENQFESHRLDGQKKLKPFAVPSLFDTSGNKDRAVKKKKPAKQKEAIGSLEQVPLDKPPSVVPNSDGPQEVNFLPVPSILDASTAKKRGRKRKIVKEPDDNVGSHQVHFDKALPETLNLDGTQKINSLPVPSIFDASTVKKRGRKKKTTKTPDVEVHEQVHLSETPNLGSHQELYSLPAPSTFDAAKEHDRKRDIPEDPDAEGDFHEKIKIEAIFSLSYPSESNNPEPRVTSPKKRSPLLLRGPPAKKQRLKWGKSPRKVLGRGKRNWRKRLQQKNNETETQSKTETLLKNTCLKEARVVLERLSDTALHGLSSGKKKGPLKLPPKKRLPESTPQDLSEGLPLGRKKPSSLPPKKRLRGPASARRKRFEIEDDTETSEICASGDSVEDPHGGGDKGEDGDGCSGSGKCVICDNYVEHGTRVLGACNVSKELFYEKLNRMTVGEGLMQITDGVLCSVCTRLLNHMDRIEVELSMLKKALLNCMRKRQVVNGNCAGLGDDHTEFQDGAGEMGVAVPDVSDNSETISVATDDRLIDAVAEDVAGDHNYEASSELIMEIKVDPSEETDLWWNSSDQPPSSFDLIDTTTLEQPSLAGDVTNVDNLDTPISSSNVPVDISSQPVHPLDETEQTNLNLDTSDHPHHSQDKIEIASSNPFGDEVVAISIHPVHPQNKTEQNNSNPPVSCTAADESVQPLSSQDKTELTSSNPLVPSCNENVSVDSSYQPVTTNDISSQSVPQQETTKRTSFSFSVPSNVPAAAINSAILVPPTSDTSKRKQLEIIMGANYFMCKLCLFTTRYKSVLLFHLRQHLKHNFRCDFCNTSISTCPPHIKKRLYSSRHSSGGSAENPPVSNNNSCATSDISEVVLCSDGDLNTRTDLPVQSESSNHCSMKDVQSDYNVKKVMNLNSSNILLEQLTTSKTNLLEKVDET